MFLLKPWVFSSARCNSFPDSNRIMLQHLIRNVPWRSSVRSLTASSPACARRDGRLLFTEHRLRSTNVWGKEKKTKMILELWGELFGEISISHHLSQFYVYMWLFWFISSIHFGVLTIFGISSWPKRCSRSSRRHATGSLNLSTSCGFMRRLLRIILLKQGENHHWYTSKAWEMIKSLGEWWEWMNQTGLGSILEPSSTDINLLYSVYDRNMRSYSRCFPSTHCLSWLQDFPRCSLQAILEMMSGQQVGLGALGAPLIALTHGYGVLYIHGNPPRTYLSSLPFASFQLYIVQVWY